MKAVGLEGSPSFGNGRKHMGFRAGETWAPHPFLWLNDQLHALVRVAYLPQPCILLSEIVFLSAGRRIAIYVQYY